MQNKNESKKDKDKKEMKGKEAKGIGENRKRKLERINFNVKRHTYHKTSFHQKYKVKKMVGFDLKENSRP